MNIYKEFYNTYKYKIKHREDVFARCVEWNGGK